MAKKLTREVLISRFIKRHSVLYDYTSVVYNGIHEKVSIICEEHGTFQQSPNNHLKGQGCPKCKNVNLSKLKRMSLSSFIEKSNLVHSDIYEYTKFIYQGSFKKGIIKCKIHGPFQQTPSDHLQGKGCPSCGLIRRSICRMDTLESFMNKATECHLGLYSYDDFIYINSKTKGDITCKEHGVFHQTPNDHLMGCGCPKCSSSKGEIIISNILSKYGLKYEREYTFTDCKDVRVLPFDFFIHSHNLLIEYDGRQHFEPIEYFGGVEQFKDQIRRDNIKTEFAKAHNIQLLRIGYYDFDNIEYILSEISI